MSRIGKKPILIPEGVEVAIQGQQVLVKGPKGELSLSLHPSIKAESQDGNIVVSQVKEDKALWGLSRTLISNMVQGVKEGYEKKLEFEGTGYKAVIEGQSLNLIMGFSHPVILQIPEGITCSVDKNTIVVSGIDKEKIGTFAATIKRVRPVEPYKGKGIRYAGQYVRRKVGKKAAGTTT